MNKFSNSGEDFEHLICGRNPVLEALRSERTIDKILVASGEREGSVLKILALAKEDGIPVVTVNKDALERLFPNLSHQGVAAYVTEKEYCSIDDILDFAKEKNEKPFLVITDGITDPHNLGSILRSADCAGVHGVILPKRRSVGMTSVVFKTSAGAAEHMRVSRVTNLADAVRELKEKNVWVFGTDGEGDTNLFDCDFDCGTALIIGSEGAGMSRLLKESCDYLVKIPLHGKVNSLNASCAATVCMFEVVRKRKGG